MDKDSLLEKLTELDFVALDLQLYLDTHPNDKEAVLLYNKTIKDSQKYRAEYEKCYGPLYSFRSYACSGSNWCWPCNPWPWECEFNFEMSRGGKYSVDL